ncbi:MAG TPA: hypothetical protein VGH19_16105 [Verrucomicrobiae bacterium]
MPFIGNTGGGGSGLDLVKRYVLFAVAAGTPSIVKASGVNSITDHGAGDYTINFDAVTDANYGVVMNGRALAGAMNAGWVGMENHDFITRTTTAVRIYTLASNVITPTDWPLGSVAIINT